MATEEAGYKDGWAQMRVESGEIWVCDGCYEDLKGGDLFWSDDEDTLCESCYAETSEDES